MFKNIVRNKLGSPGPGGVCVCVGGGGVNTLFSPFSVLKCSGVSLICNPINPGLCKLPISRKMF